MRKPGYRYWLLSRSLMGRDSMVDALLLGIVNNQSYLLNRCRDVYDDRVLRLYIEASLLATEDFDRIELVTEVPKDVLMIYHDLYYSVHDLSRLHKTQHINETSDPVEKNLKQWSLANGMSFVEWRLGMNTDKSSAESIKILLSDAYFKSREAFFSGNDTIASTEGLKWSKQAATLTKLLTELEGVDTDTDADELQLILDKITEKNIDLPSIGDLKND